MIAPEDLSLGALGPYLTIVLVAAIPTHIWRWLGVLFAGRLSEDSEVFRWIKAVATALVSGLIAQLILFPKGVLADVPMGLRVASAAVGMAAYLLSRRNLAVGILAAEAALVGAWFMG